MSLLYRTVPASAVAIPVAIFDGLAKRMKKPPQPQPGPIPWGLVLIAVLIMLLGLMFYELGSSPLEP
jgi:hypothetical protein